MLDPSGLRLHISNVLAYVIGAFGALGVGLEWAPCTAAQGIVHARKDHIELQEGLDGLANVFQSHDRLRPVVINSGPLVEFWSVATSR
jgi:hypothetical protein